MDDMESLGTFDSSGAFMSIKVGFTCLLVLLGRFGGVGDILSSQFLFGDC